MTLHLIPTGLSIITNMTPDAADDLTQNAEVWLTRPDAKLVEHIERLRTRRAMGSSGAAKSVSAEAAAHANAGGQGRLVFIASETPQGRLAARMNCLALRNAEPIVLERNVGAVPGDPGVIVISGLNPTSPSTFTSEGMANLARFMAAVAKATPKDDKVVFHLSGGFGATIPYMVLCAELLQSHFTTQPGGRSVRASMLWEHADDALELNLRHIDLAALAAEFTTGAGRPNLFGNGYLHNDGQPNDLGRAVMAFLDSLGHTAKT